MSEWISVEDRLPLEPLEVIYQSVDVIITDGENVYCGRFERGRTPGLGKEHTPVFYARWADYLPIDDDNITHWMPLPNPPHNQ